MHTSFSIPQPRSNSTLFPLDPSVYLSVPLWRKRARNRFLEVLQIDLWDQASRPSSSWLAWGTRRRIIEDHSEVSRTIESFLAASERFITRWWTTVSQLPLMRVNRTIPANRELIVESWISTPLCFLRGTICEFAKRLFKENDPRTLFIFADIKNVDGTLENGEYLDENAEGREGAIRINERRRRVNETEF